MYNSNVTNSNIWRITMDNIILGLLLMCNRTIYQLRERIDKGINLMYSSSMGSIQAAIKKFITISNITIIHILGLKFKHLDDFNKHKATELLPLCRQFDRAVSPPIVC